jgi:hypothetical protein
MRRGVGRGEKGPKERVILHCINIRHYDDSLKQMEGRREGE